MAAKYSRKKILIVDDENLIRWSLCMTLQGEDYDVHLADSAEAAMDLARKLDFDLIITDYRLKNENGLTFARRIREISPRTKVFMLTAYGTDELRERARELGVDAFIDKPFDVSFLTREVNKHLHTSKQDSPIYP